MNNDLTTNLLLACRLLDKHDVKYMVVGGAAVALYGYYRMSISSFGEPIEKPDLDFWYNPTYDNYFRLLNVIEELGEDVSRFRNEKAPDPMRSFFKLSFEAFTIDFLPSLPGLSKFRMSYENKESIDIDGLKIVFIGFDDLITNKISIGREKDIIDIEELRKRREQ